MAGAAILPPRKRCTKCDKSKPLPAFHRSSRASDGRTSWCAQCKREDQALRYGLGGDPDDPGEVGARAMAKAGLARCSRNCGALLWLRDQHTHESACQGPPRLEAYAVRRAAEAEIVPGAEKWNIINRGGAR